MTPPVSVLGVLGLCWIGLRKSTQSLVPESVSWRLCVLGVLGSRTRTRMRSSLSAGIEGRMNLYATPEKPNTPNTLNTHVSNPLNLLGFECVGFVLGWLNMCWVLISEEW
uniref:Uncharacterized protein n=1 Tax=Pseudomonas putida TaxID=303 RepID=A0A0N9MQN6_PSEPU|nr:hypothetical protein [Pseudomonas putida]